ncbi:MAG: 16S rRNA processing protein RimM [Betaproteobacteria bacterium]|nr:MAG: 16S rRNA processing protein RimM [Betaproteobacteria bacterium]TMH06669.1 MAG: 16S rRNA processing protein RimM [Betaproteobacteria bacterium]
MGRLAAPYGIEGWVKARAFTAVPGALLEYDHWWLTRQERDDAWQMFRVLKSRLHADTVVAQLEGIAAREDAMTWRGALVGVPRDMLPRPVSGEYYRDELLGLGVVNRDGQALGRVAGFLESGAHPILQVDAPDGRARLIPWVGAYIDAVDIAARRILVDWPLDF